MENIDKFLIEELAKNNTKAFDTIFNSHYLNLCRLANSIVHDEDASQNLVQQVFIRLWETRDSLEHVVHLLPYITTSVRNNCINYIKREKRSIDISALPIDLEIDNITEKQINLAEFEENLLHALNLLPQRCRIAFEFSRFEDLPNKEIALKMGISVKGVEALISRSLKLLRVSLADYLPSSKKNRIKDSILFLFTRKVRKVNTAK